ncbi:helix-turn-helix domain-containing protein [Cytobacillus sp. S13-E01]|uniref:response regulator transcription factor n=1 Tax=Cytobacillus sp. S13-E01 TaxID=3031326 RepID=UPI0023D8C0BE|nr:helix-turn-helix domain-containing protein [Cytobacillus sp. S13-E01]MDF0727272.1 helix-turn-helix domain-containing protein [Cytobacillus sp. S13-E01]
MKTIIIDDEKHVREGLLLLADWNRFGINKIFEAEDGQEAIKLISKHKPEVIFTDMIMPKVDGVNLLKWIHSSNLNSKTIVVSGYDDFEYMRNAIFYNSFDYILKPIDPELLNETLGRAVDEWKKQFLSENNHTLTQTLPHEKYQAAENSMKKIGDYLRQNYQQDINLQEIADRFFLSREYISRRFKQEFDETITDYLTRVRMDKAKELLRNPKRKIYEIAYHVGYQNEKYFSKVFKKVVGLTPNEYRNSMVSK